MKGYPLRIQIFCTREYVCIIQLMYTLTPHNYVCRSMHICFNTSVHRPKVRFSKSWNQYACVHVSVRSCVYAYVHVCMRVFVHIATYMSLSFRLIITTYMMWYDVPHITG